MLIFSYKGTKLANSFVLYIYMYMYIDICIYIYMYIYTHIHENMRLWFLKVCAFNSIIRMTGIILKFSLSICECSNSIAFYPAVAELEV
jgi:hypothetical protein